MDRREFISGIRPRTQVIEKGLGWLLILLCLGVVIRTAQAFLQAQSVGRTVTESSMFLESQNTKAKEYLEAYSKKVETFKEKGIFCPEKKEPSPPPVTGILGDSVLIGDKWCKVNEEQAGAKILKIEPAEVTILWNGKEMKVSPLQIRIASASAPAHASVPADANEQKSEPADVQQNQDANTAVAAKPADNDPLDWLGTEVSGGLRTFLLKLFEIMPANELENAKQEWAGLSNEQKKQRLDEVQKMIDSGQADTILEQLKNRQE